MMRWNPYEKVLNVNNVGSLQLEGELQNGDVVNSSPAVVNGVVYFGSNDGKVYAVNASTGALLWSYRTAGFAGSSPAVANGVVYVGSWDCKVYALNASTGALLWSYLTGWLCVFPAHSGEWGGLCRLGRQQRVCAERQHRRHAVELRHRRHV